VGIGEGDGDGIDAKGKDDGIDEGAGEDGGRGEDAQVEVLGPAFTGGTGMRRRGEGFSSSAMARSC
jgi:hypothetical protein